MTLNQQQLDQCESNTTDFSDLKALFLNCTLKRSPEMSHTDGLIAISRAIMEKNSISVLSSRRKPTPPGWVRPVPVPPISIRAPAAPKTTSPTAIPPS